MLARPNRVITGEEFRHAVRRGRRTATSVAVYYVLDTSPGAPARFGFIASRAVGDAVRRNRIRRRLRAICRELVDSGARGCDIVIRVLPGSAERTWDAVREDVRATLVDRVVAA